MPLNPVSGEIKAQPLNDNFSFLDSRISAVHGGPRDTFNSLAELKARYPNGAVSAMLVVEGDAGYLYTWNGTEWKKGPIYQAQAIGENSVGIAEAGGSLLSATYAKGQSSQKILSQYLYNDLSKNLLEKQLIQMGYYVARGTGIAEPTGSTNGCCTDFIKVKSNTTYSFNKDTVATGTSLTGCRYDENYKYISDIDTAADATTLNSGGAAYIRLNMYVSQAIGLRPQYNYLVEGTSYIPQTGGVGTLEGLKVSVDQVDGVFELSNLPQILVNNLIELERLEVNKYVNTVGNVVDSTTLSVTHFIKVQPGEKIWFKAKYGNSGYGYTYDKQPHSQIVVTPDGDINSFVVPEGMYFIRINVANSQYQTFYVNKKGPVEIMENFNEPALLNRVKNQLAAHKVQGLRVVNMFFKEERILDSYISAAGSITTSTAVDITPPIIVDSIEKLYLSRKFSQVGYFFDINGGKIASAVASETVNSNGLYEVTVPTNAYTVILNVSKPYTDTFFFNALNETTDPSINIKLPGEAKSKLFSGTIYLCGDSIIARHGMIVDDVTLKGYQGYLSELGADVRTIAVGGSTIRKYDPDISTGGFHDSAYNLIVEQQADLTDCDTLYFAWGTNESSRGINYGDITSRDPLTMCGAFRLCMEYIMGNYPHVRIVVQTPLYSEAGGHSVTELRKITDLLIQICQEYRIEFLEGLATMPVNAFNIATLMDDKLHPNNVGYELLYKPITNKLVGV
ncbi:SGNH/GDSL hydrolase family protein [Enterococcus thailandicus]